MQEIDLQRIDLNLLVMFDALMREKSVSRAAQRLNRSQSATSHALERLRQQLRDPLLIRQGGEMVPSPFAVQLYVEVQPMLRRLARALAPVEPFDPATSKRVFRLAMRDFLSGLFPDLLHLVNGSAPHTRLEWLSVEEGIWGALGNGDVDAFIGPGPMKTPSGISAQPIGALSWACFVRVGHPGCAAWSSAEWARWPHVQVGVGDPVRNPVAEAAAQVGVTRRVQAVVPVFSAVASVLANSDMVATLPRAVMRTQLAPWGLVQLPTPFAIEPIPHMVYTADLPPLTVPVFLRSPRG